MWRRCSSQPVVVVERADELARDRPPRDLELERDHVTLSPGLEEVGVHSDRHEPIVAVEAIGGCGHRLFRGGEERVDPYPQTISSRPPRRVAEPLGREERRRSERVGRCEREIREAREAGLEAVDDVEAPSAEREREVRANAHRDSDVRPPRDRDRRPDRDHVLVDSAVQGSTPGEEIARSRGRREHRDLVAEPAESAWPRRRRGHSPRAAATTRRA